MKLFEFMSKEILKQFNIPTVEEKLTIQHEYYLAITIDNTLATPVILASKYGGIDIEEVPKKEIIKIPINILEGLNPDLTKEIIDHLTLKDDLAQSFTDILNKAYKMFREIDAELLEINPLVLCNNQFIAVDAKITIDNNALYRQPNLPIVEERTATEQAAHSLGLSFVELNGDIAIMANGAGITMATLDIIQYYGGSPANFLDVGGGANIKQMTKAIEILLNKNPEVIFINILGGITRCDDVAKAFIQVNNTKNIDVPVVIRLVGTNEREGLQLLKAEGITAYSTMREAAIKAITLAKDHKDKEVG